MKHRSVETISHEETPHRNLRWVEPFTKDDEAATCTTHRSREWRESNDEIEATVQGEWMIVREIATRLQSAATKQQNE